MNFENCKQTIFSVEKWSDQYVVILSNFPTYVCKICLPCAEQNARLYCYVSLQSETLSIFGFDKQRPIYNLYSIFYIFSVNGSSRIIIQLGTGGRRTIHIKSPIFPVEIVQGLPDYLSASGLCIIEKTSNFGGGSYESKVTYSNHSALDVLQLIVLETVDNVKKQQSDDQFWDQTVSKKDHHPPNVKNTFPDEQSVQIFLNSLNDKCMAICRELTETYTYQQMLNYGAKNPPKSLVGYFMRLLGNILLRHVKTVKNKLILHHNHEVIGIRLLSDGWIQLRLLKSNYTDEQNNKIPGPRVTTAYHTIKAKSVILCVGRHQEQKTIVTNNQMTTTSELVQQDDTLIQVYQHILKNQKNNKTKVLIIGGGQSAFDCAFLLLNGPVIYKYDESQNQKTNFVQKRLNCEYANQQVKQKLKYGNQYSPPEDPDCFGNLKSQNYRWHSTNVVIPTFLKNDIQISTNFQKYLSGNFEQNYLEGQNQYRQFTNNDHVSTEQNEQFNNLKGQAKNLYQNMLNHKEERVMVSGHEYSQEQMNDFLIIIDCRELKAKTIPIRDTEGNLIQTLMQNGLYKLDQFGRIQTQKGSIRNLYGFGSCGQLHAGSKGEQSNQDTSLSFFETAQIQYLNKGLKLIEESVKYGEQYMATQMWIDQNEIPRSGQTSEYISKGDFDSDGQSQNSDLHVDQETYALNFMDSMLRKEKKMLRFDKVEKLYGTKK